MNSNKSTIFWVLLAGGILVVSITSWLIGSRVAAVVFRQKQVASVPVQKKAETQGERIKSLKSSGDEKDDNLEDRAANIAPADTFEDDEDLDAAEKQKEKEKQAREAEEEEPEKAAEKQEKDQDKDKKDEKAEKTKTEEKAETKKKEKPGEKLPPPTASGSAGSDTLYRIQLGSFENREGADKLAEDVRSKTGLSVNVIPETHNGGTRYRVQGGAFSKKDSAEKLARELELKGYKVYVKQ